jgi:pimeloyl-ACP methyl ester carboxylesterase
MEEIQTCITTALGRRVQYYTAGQAGSPVVLLHGGGIDSALLSWRMAIPELAKEHRVFAPDWPGYGGSEAFEQSYTYPVMCKWLEELVEKWELETVDLAGISMGGGGALTFALNLPDKVRRLVLVDSYGLASKVAYHRLIYWYVQADWLNDWVWALIRRSRWLMRWSLSGIFGDRRNISEELTEEVYQAVQSVSAQRAFAQFQKFETLPDRLRTCYMERLGEIRASTLIIHGERDPLVPLAAAREAARRIPDARLEVIAGAGHWPMREKPSEFNRLLCSFLGQA